MQNANPNADALSLETEVDVRRAEEYPERQLRLEDIAASLSSKPVRHATQCMPRNLVLTPLPICQITHYPPLSSAKTVTDSTRLGWVIPGDPRSELVLSLFKEGNGLPLLLNGLCTSSASSKFNSSWSNPPSAERIASISPLFYVRTGRYTTPTFVIHGTKDEIVPFRTVEVFVDALKAKGVKGDFSEAKGKRHIYDMDLRPAKGQEWWEGVGVGYDFVFRELSLC